MSTTEEPRDVLRCAACGRVPDEASITSGLQGCPGHSEEIGCGSRCFELVRLPKPRQSSADVLFDLGVALMRAQCRTLAQPEQRA